MQLKEVMLNRRSIRNYIEKEVESGKLEQIITSGLLAPSAHNRQPWEIVILKEGKEVVASIMKSFVLTHPEEKYQTLIRSSEVIRSADTVLLIYNTSKINHDQDFLSLGAMIENMLLTAIDLDMASLWIENVVPVKEEISKHFAVIGKELVSAIALGYSDHIPRFLERKTLSQAIIYDERK